MSTSGISKLVKAVAIVEEMVNITEEIEVDDDDQDSDEQVKVSITVVKGEKIANTTTKEEKKKIQEVVKKQLMK